MAEPQRIAREGLKKITQTAEESYGTMEQIGEQIQERAAELQRRVKDYSKQAGQYARENPGYVGAAVVALGAIVGLLLWRRRQSASVEIKKL